MEKHTEQNKKLKFPSELAWNETVLAIKKSLDFKSFDEFSKHLIEFLPQNSIETRKRYAQVIFQRYFTDKTLKQLCANVWKYYKDDEILQDTLRYQYLVAEPLVGEFVSRFVVNTNTEILPKETIDKFSIDLYGTVNKKLNQRLSATLKGLGFVQSQNKKSTFSILSIKLPKTALIIIIHYLYAKTPQTVMLEDILKDRCWQYLGIKWQDDVRSILREANSKSIFSKYIVADQLEQITTKYSYQELLEQKIKL